MLELDFDIPVFELVEYVPEPAGKIAEQFGVIGKAAVDVFENIIRIHVFQDHFSDEGFNVLYDIEIRF